ncbi:MAG: competence/damage-inducible protein A [Nitrospirota bacterium]
MKAALIAVGTELLWGDRVETNTVTLSDALGARGVEVAAKTVVGDDEESLARAVSDAMARAPLVILTGGLGITHDDITTRTIARVAKRRLVLRDDVLADIREAYRRRGREAPPASERQALLPVGAEALPNPVGIAPGIRLSEGGAHVVALPGVPAEMRAMFDASVAPWLAELGAGDPIPRRTVHLFGLGELEVDRRLSDLFREAACETGILASPKGVEVRLRARTTDRGVEELDRVVAEITRRLGDAVYGHDGVAMESVVGDLLRAKGWTLAVAESCTGGLVGHRLTDVSGSSRYFMGGWVTYANETKTQWLGVDRAQLAAHGAVSEPVAAMMAEGARRAAGSDVALALTGIAGPEGGSPEKPVGTLVVGLATARGTETTRWRFSGTRADTKLAFSQFGLNAVRRLLANA